MIVLVLLGYAIALAAGIIILLDAYKNGGIVHALLVFFLPIYALYWLIFRMEEKRGLVVGCWAAGFILMILPLIPSLMKSSSTASAAKADASLDVCTLLTPEQVQAEFHEAFDPGEQDIEGGFPACDYRNSSTATHKLTVSSRGCTDTSMRRMPMGENDQHLPDLGEEALTVGDILVARKGPRCYTMSMSGLPVKETLESRKNLMRTLLSGLK